jgi:hypothetical protein
LNDESLRRNVAVSAKRRYLAQWVPAPQFTNAFTKILAAPTQPERGAFVSGAPLFYESVGRSRGVAFLHALHRRSPMRAMQEMFTNWLARLEYWRGFVAAIIDTVGNRLRQA